MVKSLKYKVLSLLAVGLFALGSCHKADIHPCEKDEQNDRSYTEFEKGNDDDDDEGGLGRGDDDITITDPNHDEDEDAQIKR